MKNTAVRSGAVTSFTGPEDIFEVHGPIKAESSSSENASLMCLATGKCLPRRARKHHLISHDKK